MPKATFTIGFKATTADIVNKKRSLRREFQDHNLLAAGRTALDIAEDYLDQSVLGNSTERLDAIDQAIKYCRKAVRLFEQIQEDVEAATRADVEDNDQRPRDFQHAFQHNARQTRIALELGDAYPEARRIAFKNHADTYFTRGQSDDCARRDDFVNARLYYEKERGVLDQMTDADYDDPIIRASCLRASDMNLGTIYTKLVIIGVAPPTLLDDARQHLEKGLKASVEDDPEDQREAYFALWSMWKANRDFSRAIEIQFQELRLIRQHKLGGEVECLRDIVDTYRAMGEYDRAVAMCRELLHSKEVARDPNARAYTDAEIHTLVEMRDKVNSLSHLTMSRTERHVVMTRLARLFFDARQYDKAKQYLEEVIGGQEMDNPEQTVEILGLYADTLWANKAMPYETVLSAHKTYMDAIKAHIVADPRRRTELVRENLAQLERVHEYYGHVGDAEESALLWARMGGMVDEEYHDEEGPSTTDVVGDRVERSSGSVKTSDTLKRDEDVLMMDIEFEETETNTTKRLEQPTASLPQLSGTSSVRIVITVAFDQETLLIPCPDGSKAVEWLIGEAESKAELLFGGKVKIKHLILDGLILHPKDLIADIDTSGNAISAVIYKNTCARLDILVDPMVLELLEEAMKSGDASLAALGFETKTLKPVALALNLGILNHLDLSQNMLSDASLSLFSITPTPAFLPHLSRLDLFSNRITAKGLMTFLEGLDVPTLQELDMSYNPLGVGALELLADCVMRFARLNKLSMEYCNVSIDVEEAAVGRLRTKYEACVMCEYLARVHFLVEFMQKGWVKVYSRSRISNKLRVSFFTGAGANLSLNLANNKSISPTGVGDLIKLLVHIPRIELLDLSRLQRSAGWGEIGSLSRLLHLKELNLQNSDIGPEGAKAVGILLKRSLYLAKLDLAYCELNFEACVSIADGLMLNKTLTSLNLRGNPLISKHGSNVIADALHANPGSLLKDINLAACGIDDLNGVVPTVDLSHNGPVGSVENLNTIAVGMKYLKYECGTRRIRHAESDLWRLATVTMDVRADYCAVR
ncbi:hypothetical protein BC938DRAFT_470881 [Jimgerdemannia flammicorona]|uniref:Uncharacterized protein n=1 Tax=Jimgerdemannia flammicorona TaxID=994334 RepID=A0A433Q9D3_9FUNG|nr:hypothetical protein BC938DRAFT_470881 [Jimgerdemannia flammicorona]